MGNGLTARAAFQVARVFRDGTLVGMSDRQIFERFVERRDELAFEAIVTRHGAMVRNVCRQILFDPHDVDDAVQAVFLVLVRKARSIRIEESLGPWLYSVAARVAARARANRRKRWAREVSNRELPEPSYSSPTDAGEISAIIHDELGRLPERLRAPLVLCYLEGLTHDLAARQLNCPVGTVCSRLARGRNVLHQRMIRRGLTLSAAALGGVLESNASAAAASLLPASLVASITGAMLETVKQNGTGLSTSFAMILEGVLSVLPIKKIGILATAISVGAVAFVVVERTTVGQTPEPKSQVSQVLDSPLPLEAPKGPRAMAIESKLNQTVSMNLDRQPLSRAVVFLQNDTGLNIVLDPKALAENGLTSSSPVTLSVMQVPLKTVLKLLLKPLGLTYKLEDDVVLITSPQSKGPDGRRIGPALAKDGKVAYPKTYYVGDLLPRPLTDQRRISTGPASGEAPRTDMTPLIDLIELSIAPGTWLVDDGYGDQVPNKKDFRGTILDDQRNVMVPFYLSISLIIKCSAEVHDDVAKLLRCLRRLQEPWDGARAGDVLVANPRRDTIVSDLRAQSQLDMSRAASTAGARSPRLTADQGAAQPAKPAKTDRQATIDRLMKELQEALDEGSRDTGREANGIKRTDVVNMPDVDVVVSESKRVLVVGGTTTFQIRVTNHGTKEATNLRLTATLSPNLEFHAIAGGPKGVNVAFNTSKDTVKFDQIDRLGPGKVMVFGIHVKAVGEKPKLAMCKVVFIHDGLTDTFEDMAGVKVKTGRRAAADELGKLVRKVENLPTGGFVIPLRP